MKPVGLHRPEHPHPGRKVTFWTRPRPIFPHNPDNRTPDQFFKQKSSKIIISAVNFPTDFVNSCMRKHSYTTKLFQTQSFQDFLLSKYSVDAEGYLIGASGRRIYGADNGLGYRLITVHYQNRQVLLLAHRLVFFLAHKRVPGEIDHIDGNRGNNVLSNLRETTHSQNMGFTPKRFTATTTSQFKGVSWVVKMKKWRASCAGKYLGIYENELDAAKAYDAFAKVHYGPNCYTNF